MANPFRALEFGNKTATGSHVTNVSSLTNASAKAGIQWGPLKARVPELAEEINDSIRIAGGGSGMEVRSTISRTGIYFNGYIEGEQVAHVSLHSDSHGAGGNSRRGPGAFHTKSNNTGGYERAKTIVARTESNVDGYVQFRPAYPSGKFRDERLADVTFTALNSVLSSGHEFYKKTDPKAGPPKGGGNCDCEDEYTVYHLRFQNIDPKYQTIYIDIYNNTKDYSFYTDENIEENVSIKMLTDDAQTKIKSILHIITNLFNAVQQSMAVPETTKEVVKEVTTYNKKSSPNNLSTSTTVFGGSKKRNKTKKIRK